MSTEQFKTYTGGPDWAPTGVEVTGVNVTELIPGTNNNMVHQWGVKRTPLVFDRHPYPDDGDPFGYEAEVITVFEHFVEPGDLVVDAGASVGYHTCLLSGLVGLEGIVLAFEPHLPSFKFLAEHVHLSNKCRNVAVFREALWKCDVEGLELSSVQHLGYSSLHRYKHATSTETVRGRALDSILMGPDEHPRLIKIDCEGSEAEVLLGAQKILEKGVDCVVLELNYFIMEQVERSDRIIREFMASLGYDMFLINIGNPKEGFHSPIRVEPTVPILLEGGHCINVMFSTVEKVRQRWKTEGISNYSMRSGENSKTASSSSTVAVTELIDQRTS